MVTAALAPGTHDADAALDIEYQQGKDNPFPNRLANAMEWSRRALRFHRTVRHAIVDEITGGNYSRLGFYGHQSQDNMVPVNMLEMAKSTYARQMVASNPTALISTPHKSLRSSAFQMEQATNQLLKMINFEDTLYGWVDDSIIQLGMLKVGITDFDADGVYGSQHKAGQPFAERVDFDDLVMDMNSRKWEEMQYVGHRFRVPLEYIMDSGLYTNKENLSPSYYRRYNEEGDERVEVLSRGFEGDPEDLFDMVELWEVFIPWANRLVTVVSDDSRTSEPRFIRSEPWKGPPRGPFHPLWYNDVPNNIMPISPASLLMDLHLIGNRLFVKLASQAERQKTILGAQGTAMDDAERVVAANDGETIRMENPERAKEFRFGGADEANLIFFTHVKELFNYYGGNLELLAGLGPQSDTATQDKMLAAGAGKRIAHMQGRMITATTKVMEDLVWWMWNDPQIKIPYTFRIPNTRYERPAEWTKDDTAGKFFQYNYTIEPYSMQHRSPEMRAAQITELFQNFLIPMADLNASQGIVPNMQETLRLLAKYKNMHEIEHIMMFQEPDPNRDIVGEAPSHRSTTPQSTSRTYNRVSTSRTTAAGRDQEMIQSLQSLRSSGGNGTTGAPTNGSGRT